MGEGVIFFDFVWTSFMDGPQNVNFLYFLEKSSFLGRKSSLKKIFTLRRETSCAEPHKRFSKSADGINARINSSPWFLWRFITAKVL